jgi:hypothetical protein
MLTICERAVAPRLSVACALRRYLVAVRTDACRLYLYVPSRAPTLTVPTTRTTREVSLRERVKEKIDERLKKVGRLLEIGRRDFLG